MNQPEQHRPYPSNKPNEPDRPDRPDRPEYHFDDEIELMDYLRVIWKWKYLIAAGTLICAVAAGMITFSTPKVYRIGMVIQPGILTINEAGNEVYVDSPGNIKAIIEAGTFDGEILNGIGESNNNAPLRSLNFKVNIVNNSNILKISHKTANADLGLQIMNRLSDLLLQRYGERVKYFQGVYKAQIGSKKAEMTNYEVRRRASQQQIKNIQKRIDKLTSQLRFIKEKRGSLIQEKDKFLSKNTSENNPFSAVLYTNTIQQNIALENTCRQQINEYITKREDEKLNLEELDGEEKRLSEEIKGLEFKKNNIQNIEILSSRRSRGYSGGVGQPPTAGPHPIKPKIKINIMLATVAGLFAMMFLAFFLEYVQKHRGGLEQ
ncbi:MAG: hypothetical protein HWN69_05015 [Desulfobacterales bacterium]|nr:hypothetical protein [Desulfobacterales bacterium]